MQERVREQDIKERHRSQHDRRMYDQHVVHIAYAERSAICTGLHSKAGRLLGICRWDKASMQVLHISTTYRMQLCPT